VHTSGIFQPIFSHTTAILREIWAFAKSDRACQDFIRGYLGGYGVPVKSVKAECADAGFSLRTIERAAHNLGLVLMRKYGMNMWFPPEAAAKARE
jgi:hypothetical protein